MVLPTTPKRDYVGPHPGPLLEREGVIGELWVGARYRACYGPDVARRFESSRAPNATVADTASIAVAAASWPVSG